MSSRTRRAVTALAVCCVAVACGRTTTDQRSIELGVLEDNVTREGTDVALSFLRVFR
jgi:hypothetical protein